MIVASLWLSVALKGQNHLFYPFKYCHSNCSLSLFTPYLHVKLAIKPVHDIFYPLVRRYVNIVISCNFTKKGCIIFMFEHFIGDELKRIFGNLTKQIHGTFRELDLIDRFHPFLSLKFYVCVLILFRPYSPLGHVGKKSRKIILLFLIKVKIDYNPLILYYILHI